MWEPKWEKEWKPFLLLKHGAECLTLMCAAWWMFNHNVWSAWCCASLENACWPVHCLQSLSFSVPHPLLLVHMPFPGSTVGTVSPGIPPCSYRLLKRPMIAWWVRHLIFVGGTFQATARFQDSDLFQKAITWCQNTLWVWFFTFECDFSPFRIQTLTLPRPWTS